jgi:hypothetical protein
MQEHPASKTKHIWLDLGVLKLYEFNCLIVKIPMFEGILESLYKLNM